MIGRARCVAALYEEAFMTEASLKHAAKAARIADQEWPEGTKPVVTIRCTTYNHVRFIGKCVEGFLMQETTFPVEIVFHDDASTDGTQEFIQQLLERFPPLIKAILQPKNLRPRGLRRGEFLAPMLRGDYIAFCEGDDYWTDPEKLQKQVDFLEANPEYVLRRHDIFEVDEHDTVLRESALSRDRRRDHRRDELIRPEAWLGARYVHRAPRPHRSSRFQKPS